MAEEEQTEEQTAEQTAEKAEEQAEEQSTALKNTVTIEEAGPCKKRVSIEIPEETIKSAIDKEYGTLSKEALVPGFRKGRAPRRLLEKRFGKDTTEQVKLKLLAEAGESALKDNELQIYPPFLIGICMAPHLGA